MPTSGPFTFPSDAVALVDALKKGLASHVHDEFTNETTADLTDFLALLGDRDRAVEGFLGLDDYQFSQGGALTVVTWPSTGLRPGANRVLGFWGTLGTVGSTVTTGQVLKNGSPIPSSSLSFAANATIAGPILFPPNVFVPRSLVPGAAHPDQLSVQTTVVGTGAKDVTWHVVRG